MKSLIIVEHNNNSIKQSTYSSITASSKISSESDALIIGYGLSKAIDEDRLKKSDFLKKIYVIDKEVNLLNL